MPVCGLRPVEVDVGLHRCASWGDNFAVRGLKDAGKVSDVFEEDGAILWYL